jgi:hypothetical protein
MLQLSGHGGADPPVVTFPAVNIRDAVHEDVRIVVPTAGGRATWMLLWTTRITLTPRLSCCDESGRRRHPR